MRRIPRRVAIATLLAGTVAAGATAIAIAGPGGLDPVPAAQPKAVGMAEPNVLSAGLADVEVARGSMPLENPSGIVTRYGYVDNGPMLPALGSNAEAQKTEPDKNTYLVFRRGLSGADPAYDYGTHFLFQGHETGPSSYMTRINLDADAAHRVTLLGTLGANVSMDGSTWDPFARRLLFTGEVPGSTGGVWQATPDYPATVERVTAFGYGGFEGVQADSAGRLWLVSDIGGSKGTLPSTRNARQPNSFVYRFIPADRHDLMDGGKLQALQVTGKDGQPIVFGASADADILSQNVADLHTYGNTFATRWVTIHDTATDGFDPFDANAAAKTAEATPFKRPENGLFRPGSDFREFFFTETGDTDLTTAAGAAYGGFGGLFRLTQKSPRSATGTLSLFFLGDPAHTGLDNISFLSKHIVLATEDAGDTVHTQRSALDSGFAFDTRTPIGTAPTPTRFLAEGRDASATIDSALLGSAGFVNDGDNEITGIHVSDGDPTVDGLLGAEEPHAFHDGWRVFWTQQHGDNVTYEIVRQ